MTLDRHGARGASMARQWSQEACARATEVGLDCQPANDIGAALEDLLATQPAPMRILICGSLYLAGDVLARNG